MRSSKIAASLMCADLLNLQKSLDVFSSNGIDYLHIDIMDGHYVPNFTLGTDFCRLLNERCSIPLDIHLMIENLDQHLSKFCLPGSLVSFHPEVSYHPVRTLQAIRSAGCKAGIAIEPAISMESVKCLLDYVDFICVMTVSPGYSGQTLIPGCIEKTREISEYIAVHSLDIDVEVDGNASWGNIPRMLDAGANIIVAGTSSLFDNADLAGNIKKLRSVCDSASAVREEAIPA